MPERSINKGRRHEIERELCDSNEYFIYQCTDKEIQKGRVAASRAKVGTPGKAAASLAGLPKASPVRPGVPISRVKSDLKQLQKVKERAVGSASNRKLDDPAKEKTAQAVSDKISRSVTKLRNSNKPVSERIDDALTSEGLSGSVRSRARSLTASKSVRSIKSILS